LTKGDITDNPDRNHHSASAQHKTDMVIWQIGFMLRSTRCRALTMLALLAVVVFAQSHVSLQIGKDSRIASRKPNAIR